ncbi:uncharacterized protein [Medicago truncatula]|uniref:uncharacterized protein n=1 Tax=Medicago truncatula TaxID=3880 RepID=UPI001967FC13|nr:uncharacterized protein LOC120579532 [Medicago truncatula]
MGWLCVATKIESVEDRSKGLAYAAFEEFGWSVTGCMYKVLAKVLANRLRCVISSVVSDTQSAFVRGKQILDGILIANEVVDEAKRMNKELLLFKVDFEKAYDSVDLKYLDAVMVKMNFPTIWQKGLRQGEPLSPFLFLLAAEGLNVLMKAVVGAQLFTGYGVGGANDVRVTHLQFTDDTLIIGEKSWPNVRSMTAVLLLFEEASGLKFNFHKSMLTCVNVSDSWLSEAALVMNCPRGAIPFIYLGLPIGGDSRKISFWKPVIDRIVAHFTYWSNKLLSYGGRLEEGGLGVRKVGGAFNLSLLGKWCWRLVSEREGLWYSVLKARYGESRERIKDRDRRGSQWWRAIC